MGLKPRESSTHNHRGSPFAQNTPQGTLFSSNRTGWSPSVQSIGGTMLGLIPDSGGARGRTTCGCWTGCLSLSLDGGTLALSPTSKDGPNFLHGILGLHLVLKGSHSAQIVFDLGRHCFHCFERHPTMPEQVLIDGVRRRQLGMTRNFQSDGWSLEGEYRIIALILLALPGCTRGRDSSRQYLEL
jgi:hypothetical protein